MSSPGKSKKLQKLKDKIFNVLGAHCNSMPEGIPISDFWNLYQKKYGSIKKAEFGLKNLNQVFSIFENEFTLVTIRETVCVKAKPDKTNKSAGSIKKGGDKVDESSPPRKDIKNIDDAIKVLKGLVISVLKDKPEGLRPSQFWERFYILHGDVDTDPKSYGINSKRKSDLLKLMPDVIAGDPGLDKSILKLKSGTKKDCTKSAFPTHNIEVIGTKPDAKGTIPSIARFDLDALQEDVLEVLNQHPEGLLESEFWKIYQKTHDLTPKQLPKPSEYNVSSRQELLNLFEGFFDRRVEFGVSYIRSKNSMSGWYIDRRGGAGGNHTSPPPQQPPSSAAAPRHYAIPAAMLQPPQHYTGPQFSFMSGYSGAPAMNQPPAGPSQAQDGRSTTVHSIGTGAVAGGRSRERSGDRERSSSRNRDDYGRDNRNQHNKYPSSRPSSSASNRKQGGWMHIPKDQLNVVAEDCIDRLSDSKEYVSVERIEKLILQHYNVNALNELGIRYIEEINCIREHARKQCKVNAYIQAFITCRSIGTFHELNEHLRDFVPDKQEFEQLQLGPLTKQPLIFKFFQIPQSGEIAEIDTSDILEYLKQYLTEKNLWTDKKHTVTEFLTYIVEQRGLDSPYELGIRLRSLPLAIQVLKKSQRDLGQTFRNACDSQKQSLQNDVQQAYQHFLTSLLMKEPGICVFRQELCASEPLTAVCRIFTRLISLYNTLDMLQPQTNGARKAARKRTNTITIMQQFLNTLSQDPLLMKIFQFSICLNDAEIEGQLSDLAQIEAQMSNAAAAIAQSAEQKAKPPIDDIATWTVKFLERCILSGSLSLNHMSRIETKLLEEYAFNDFTELTGDTFLNFIQKTPHIKKFLTECGGSSLGFGPTASGASGCPYQANFKDILAFIQQTGMKAEEPFVSMLENALCNHYCVLEVSALGHGSISHLCAASQRQTIHTEVTVVYENAIMAKSSTNISMRNRQAGVLGHQTKDKALAALQHCPLLEDMSEWCHWELVFQPELGSLKDFLYKYGGVMQIPVTENNIKMNMHTNVIALEVSPGKLLRISTDTSPDKVANSALNRDARNFCGHLVSLIVSSKGVENAPIALVSNHLKTALLKMQANANTTAAPGAPGHSNQNYPAANFVLECLVILPKTIAAEIANKVFLDPLSHAIGISKSKEVLLNCAKSSIERTRLQHLGMVLGIQPWIDSFSPMLCPPRECLGKIEALDLGQGLGEVVEIEEEESDAEVIDEDESSDFLSDVEIVDTSNRTMDLTEPEKADDKKPEEAASEEPSNTAAEAEPERMDVSEDEQEGDAGDQEEAADAEVVNEQLQIVEKIRREEFGVGVELSEDGEKLMRKQQERQGRSLDRLSRDLYSKDTHFVLELIQNADDNSYGDNITCPTVKFVVDDECISVFNNEAGFEEKNIRALCDVGQSTKGKHKFGYIGQKGIGFKSVFRITDRPEVHSRGFHICFDVTSGPMGYILPHWIGHPDIEAQDSDWTTCIKLPLKDEMRTQGQASSLVARFHDVHPSLLLFLHRLRKLTIVNQMDDAVVNMCRRDVGENVIEISHGSTTDRWLVVKKMLDASQISLQAKSGVEVESTEIALAFPIQAKATVYAQVLPEKQPVFAFLPLRSYGFRFVIQGDFDVPSSREDVDRDSVWNQWLRNEIHHAFIEALESFKNHAGLNELEAICNFLRYVPLEDEILDFFKPVATNILQQLKAKPCLPSSGLQWKLPSQLVLCQDSIVREVMTSSLLKQHLGLDYLHKDVAAALNPLLIQNLGIQTLSIQHLVDIGKVIIAGLHQPTDDREKSIQMIAKWLVCIYRAMDDFAPDEIVLRELKSLSCIPCADGQITALDNRSVFFPLDTQDGSPRGARDYVQTLQQDLNTVHNSLFEALDDVMNSQLHRLLEDLGVKKLNPSDIIHHHILPILKTDEWMEKPRTLHFAYLMYMKECIDRQPSILKMEELAKYAVLLTNRGLKRPVDDSIHLTPAFGEDIFDFRIVFSDNEWLVVDSCYLQGCTPTQIRSWKEFLQKLGAIKHLALNKQDLALTPEEMSSSPWAAYKEILPEADQYYISDYVCKEFNMILNVAETKPASQRTQERMAQLYTLLEKNWNTYYDKFTLCQVRNVDGQVLKDVETSFGLALKKSCWIPSEFTKIEVFPDGNNARMLPNVGLERGENLFINHPTISNITGHHVSYMRLQPSPGSSLSRFLGIKSSIGVEEVQKMLVDWCNQEQTTFVVMDHVINMYEYLHSRLPPIAQETLFQQNPIIFYTPGQAPRGPGALVRGQFLSRDKVRWTDPIGLFDKYESSLGSLLIDTFKKPIQHLYSGMEGFFLRFGQIQQAPSMDEYISLLVELTATAPMTKALEDALKIYTFCGRQFHETDDPTQKEVQKIQLKAVQKAVKGKAIIPASNKWVRLDDMPMIPDDKNYEKMFKEKEGVFLVEFGKSAKPGKDIDLDAVRQFLRVLGVESLSESVEMMSVTENFQQFPNLQGYMSDIVKYVQLFLQSTYEQIYEKHVNRGTGSYLAAMSFASVGKLEMVHSLRQLPLVVVVKTERCQIIDDQQFCVHHDFMNSFNDINKELARYFSLGDTRCFRETKSFLTELLPLVQNPSPELQRLIDEYDLGTLPDNEEPWTVPQPIIHIAPEPVQEYVEDEVEESVFAMEEPMEVQGSGASDGVLRAWPPRAGTVPVLGAGGPSKAETTDKLWPPPQPPEYVDKTSLPANLRPSKFSTPGDTKESTSSDDVTRPSPSTSDTRRTSPAADRSTSRTSQSSSGDVPTPRERSSQDGTPITPGGGGGTPGSVAPGGPPRSASSSRASDTSAPRTSASQNSMLDSEPGDPAQSRSNEDMYVTCSSSSSSSELVSRDSVTSLTERFSAVDTQSREALPEREDMFQGGEEQTHPEDPVVIEFHGYYEQRESHRSLKRQRLDSSGHAQGSPTKATRPIIFHGPPVWLEGASDEVYEPVASGESLTLPEGLGVDEGSGQKEVGHWGELLVKRYLDNLLEAGGDIVGVLWMNENNESGKPFDFVVQVKDPEHQDLVLDTFIEVKSTLSDKKAFFEISAPELKFAMEKNERFHVYRVFNAGKPNLVRISKLENLSQKMLSKQVRVAMVV